MHNPAFCYLRLGSSSPKTLRYSVSLSLRRSPWAAILNSNGGRPRFAIRFNELQRSLGNVSPTTLADRLKKLENYGLITQQKQTVDQLSVIYSLTEKGKKMLPVLTAIESFSKKFL